MPRKYTKHNFVDQPAIDFVCRGKIKYIDYRYNFFASFLDDYYEIVKKCIPEYILNDIRIIHFTGYKCWFKDFSHSTNIVWYKYFMKTPFFKKISLFKMKFELFRYKTCLITTKSSKHDKYKKKIYVLSKMLNNMKN